MDQEQKTAKQEKITAIFTKDSRRYHRFDIEEGQGIVGTIYFPKDGEKIPDELTVVLKTRARGQDDSPDS